MLAEAVFPRNVIVDLYHMYVLGLMVVKNHGLPLTFEQTIRWLRHDPFGSIRAEAGKLGYEEAKIATFNKIMMKIHFGQEIKRTETGYRVWVHHDSTTKKVPLDWEYGRITREDGVTYPAPCTPLYLEEYEWFYFIYRYYKRHPLDMRENKLWVKLARRAYFVHGKYRLHKKGTYVCVCARPHVRG